VFPIKERVAELEGSVKDLERQLLEQEQEAESAISQWQKNCSELDAKFSKLESQYENVEDGVTHNVETLADRDWTIEQLQSEVESCRGKLDGLEASSRAEKEQLEEELAVERGRHAEARDEIESLEEARDESEQVLTQWTGTYLIPKPFSIPGMADIQPFL
jgi:chromosome segregation ATPase